MTSDYPQGARRLVWQDRLVKSAGHRAKLPRSLRPLFPEIDITRIDANRDSRFVIARVLETGLMVDVAWCVQHYGLDRIHSFFRDEGDPSLSPRTIALWRLVLGARNERWAAPRRSQLHNVAPWPG